MHRSIKFISLLAVSSLIFGSADSAPRRHQFQDELCTYEIRYDTGRTSDDAVKGTIELLYNVGLSSIVSTEPLPTTMDDAKRMDTAKLEAACAARIADIEKLSLLPVDGLPEFRRLLVDSVNDSCLLDRLGQLGFQDPSRLREHPASAKCTSFVDALEGRTDINAVFDKLTASQCARNSDPKGCLQRTRKLAADPAAQRIYLQTYGWHNCVNQFNRQVDDKRRQTLIARFQKKYAVKRLRCDQP